MTATLELACTQSGQGEPVIMLHGLYGSGNNWRGIARALENDYRVLRPDLRNHGQSPHDPDMDYRSMAADVVALMDASGIDRASLIGHSMGGKVAMALALMHPERLERLVVVDIAPVTYDHSQEHGGIIRALQAIDLASVKSREDADRQLEERITTPMVRQFLLTNLQRQGDGWSWRIPLDILADQLPVIQSWPSALANSWAGPACFLYGGNSSYVNQAGIAEARQRFPNAQFDCIEGVGHWVHAEAPAAFIDRIQHFQGNHHG